MMIIRRTRVHKSNFDATTAFWFCFFQYFSYYVYTRISVYARARVVYTPRSRYPCTSGARLMTNNSCGLSLLYGQRWSAPEASSSVLYTHTEAERFPRTSGRESETFPDVPNGLLLTVIVVLHECKRKSTGNI